MAKKLKSNPFRKDSAAWRFCEICNLDYNNGYSKIISLDILIKHDLGMGNGGSWCRSDGPLGKYFNINRKQEKGKIVSVQLVGWKKNKFDNCIKKEIKDLYKKFYCRILYIRPIEVDHKDGRKDNFGLSKNQKSGDFQPLHKTANDAKRQHCKNCKETGMRFDAKRLGYKVPQWIGPPEYMGDCTGCFWHDPAEFNTIISDKFDKEK